MSISDFASNHSVRIKRDGCSDLIIPGKRFCAPGADRIEYRSHIYDNGDGQLGVCMILPTPKKWGFTRRKLQSAGFQLRQDGDTEGTLLFDPADKDQARLALQVCGVKKIRQASEAMLQALAQARAKKAA